MQHPVPQGHQFSPRYRLTSGSPPEAPKPSHNKHKASTPPQWTHITQGHSTTPPTRHLTSYPVWAGQHLLHTTTPTCTTHLPRLPPGPAASVGSRPDAASPLTSCHAYGSRCQIGDTPTYPPKASTCMYTKLVPTVGRLNHAQPEAT